MTIWRWRHDRSPLPDWTVKALPDLIQEKAAEAHLAQNEFELLSKATAQAAPDAAPASSRP